MKPKYNYIVMTIYICLMNDPVLRPSFPQANAARKHYRGNEVHLQVSSSSFFHIYFGYMPPLALLDASDYPYSKPLNVVAQATK